MAQGKESKARDRWGSKIDGKNEQIINYDTIQWRQVVALHSCCCILRAGVLAVVRLQASTYSTSLFEVASLEPCYGTVVASYSGLHGRAGYNNRSATVLVCPAGRKREEGDPDFQMPRQQPFCLAINVSLVRK